MPELAPVLVGALRAGLAWLATQTIAGGIGAVKDALITLGRWVDWFMQVTGDVFAAAKGAEDYSEAWATEAGQQVAELGSDVKQITEHTYQTVIPHSMSWLAGWLIAGPIDQLRLRIAQLQDQVNFLLGWRAQIDAWRHEFVDPNVEKWVGFRQWFDGWPQGILFRWHSWLQHPSEFGAWAAAPVTGPIIAYLADPDHQTSRDNLAAIMVDAWQAEPERVWDAMLEWLVS